MRKSIRSENWCVDCAHDNGSSCKIGMKNPDLYCDGFVFNLVEECDKVAINDPRELEIIELKAAISAMADLLTETQEKLEQKTARHNEAMAIIEKQRLIIQSQKGCVA